MASPQEKYEEYLKCLIFLMVAPIEAFYLTGFTTICCMTLVLKVTKEIATAK